MQKSVNRGFLAEKNMATNSKIRPAIPRNSNKISPFMQISKILNLPIDIVGKYRYTFTINSKGGVNNV